MTGSRSYVHVTVNPASPAGGLSAEQATANLRKIEEGRQAIAVSEAERGKVLDKAKEEIKEYAALQEKLKKANSPGKEEKLRRKMAESGARLDAYEKKYFSLDAKEKDIERAAENTRPF